MKEFWDERFAAKEYVYGILPNNYYKSWLDRLNPGRLLLPGEGEGRNAVYAAKVGWQVDAYDLSEQAKKKALKLGQDSGVSLNYHIGHLEELSLQEEEYDLIALIFLHLPGEERRNYHRKLIQLLKPGGLILIESFSKEQINNNTGGPKSLDMLYSLEDLSKDLQGLEVLEKLNLEADLEEGSYHRGKALLSRIVAKK